MRPRRLYYEPETKKPYYIINKKKVYVKVPKGVSMKQLQKVNIKNIITLPRARRVKRRNKRVKAEFEKKLVPASMVKSETTTVGGLPTYLFEEKKTIPELATAGKEKKKPELTLVPSSTILKPYEPPEPTIALPRIDQTPKKTEETKPKEEEKPKKEKKEKTAMSGNNAYDYINMYVSENGLNIVKLISDWEDGKNKEIYANFLKWHENEGQSKTIGGKLVSKKFHPPSDKVFIDNLKSFVKYPPRGKGMGDDDGLYNDQIETITKKRLKRFVPCIPADKTEDLMKYVHRGDKEFAFVINTNPSESDGSGNDGYRSGHWTCVYFDNRDDYPSAEFYDPLAEGKPPVAVVKIMRRIAKKINPEKMFKYKQNMIRRQSYSSSYCGQHCIKFIEDRMNGESFCDASGYDDYIKKNQGADDSIDGERELSKYIPKYNSYV